MMKRLLLAAVLAIFLLGGCGSGDDATAQTPKEYYEASVASDDFILDLAYQGGGSWNSLQLPTGITIRVDIDCTVTYVDAEPYVARDDADVAPGSVIHIFASERKYIQSSATRLQIEGALGAELAITVEY